MELYSSRNVCARYTCESDKAIHRMTLRNSCISVKIGMELSEPFDTVRGFRQGNRLACNLFNFVLQSVPRKAGVGIEDNFRIRSNSELYKLLNDIEASQHIYIQRLR